MFKFLQTTNRLEHPCENCEAPYGFKNHMALDNDTKKFTVRIATIYIFELFTISWMF